MIKKDNINPSQRCAPHKPSFTWVIGIVALMYPSFRRWNTVVFWQASVPFEMKKIHISKTHRYIISVGKKKKTSEIPGSSLPSGQSQKSSFTHFRGICLKPSKQVKLEWLPCFRVSHPVVKFGGTLKVLDVSKATERWRKERHSKAREIIFCVFKDQHDLPLYISVIDVIPYYTISRLRRSRSVFRGIARRDLQPPNEIRYTT